MQNSPRVSNRNPNRPLGPACPPGSARLRQAQAVIFKPGTGQAGQAKTLRRPGGPLKMHRLPACDIFANFRQIFHS